MKKVLIFIVACALLSFSCNKYCNCKHYVDGKLEKSYKSDFITESKSCKDYNVPLKEVEGKTYETKCK